MEIPKNCLKVIKTFNNFRQYNTFLAIFPLIKLRIIYPKLLRKIGECVYDIEDQEM